MFFNGQNMFRPDGAKFLSRNRFLQTFSGSAAKKKLQSSKMFVANELIILALLI